MTEKDEMILSRLAHQAGYPMLVVLSRHARSLRNEVKKGNIYLPDDESAALVQGIPDHRVPITEFGWEQARQTGRAIRERFGLFDAWYTSGYLRTGQTLEGILEAYTEAERQSMIVRTNPLIAERQAGYTYNMTTEQANFHFPYLQEHWELQGPFFGVPPGGESQYMVYTRTKFFKHQLKDTKAGLKVFAETHGGTTRALRMNYEHWTPEEYIAQYAADPPQNCGVTVYQFSPKTGTMELVEYNTVYWKE